MDYGKNTIHTIRTITNGVVETIAFDTDVKGAIFSYQQQIKIVANWRTLRDVGGAIHAATSMKVEWIIHAPDTMNDVERPRRVLDQSEICALIKQNGKRKYTVREHRSEVTHTDYIYTVEATSEAEAQAIVEERRDGVEWVDYMEVDSETLASDVTVDEKSDPVDRA
jgi:hypothetical protein